MLYIGIGYGFPFFFLFSYFTGLYTNRIESMRRHIGESFPRCHSWTLRR